MRSSTGAAQPGRQRAGEDADLAVELRLVFQHRQHQRRGTGPAGPAHAVARRQVPAAAGFHAVEAPLAGRLVAIEGRGDAAQGGRGLPDFVAIDVVDAGVQAGLRQCQPRLGQLRRHHQRAAIVDLRPGQQQVDRALQAGEVGGPHAVGVGPLHHVAGGGHEGHQHQRRSQQQPGADRVAGPHPSVKR
jgi:hypothetical protein